MIEVEMSADIQETNPKIFWILDKRQIKCVAIGGAAGYLTWLLLKDTGIDIAITLTVVALVIAAPASCGWWKMFGMYIDVFLVKCVLPQLISPSKRIYKSESTLESLLPKAAKLDSKLDQKVKMERSKKKKLKKDQKKYRAAR